MIKHSKLKQISFLAMTLMACLPSYANEHAEQRGELGDRLIQPYFSNISIFQNVFDLSSGGKASISSYLTAREVDQVTVEANLQQNKNGVWTTIKTWSNTSAGTNSGTSGTYYVLSGYGYRLMSVGNVYKNGNLIEQTTYVSETKNY